MYDFKNNLKQNPAKAAVTVPAATPDQNRSHVSAQAEQGAAKITVQPGAEKAAKTEGTVSGDRSDSEAMINEGGHASSEDARHGHREPDAKTGSMKGSIDGESDGAASKLSEKSAS
ncbi:MAG TPA: hypothetical protein VHP13_11700 [Gammaproteobacteria bacterium]|jgi:hypothetical protein|nr:hypothetical protein [Gammaproteobacteria bacterium]